MQKLHGRELINCVKKSPLLSPLTKRIVSVVPLWVGMIESSMTYVLLVFKKSKRSFRNSHEERNEADRRLASYCAPRTKVRFRLFVSHGRRMTLRSTPYSSQSR